VGISYLRQLDKLFRAPATITILSTARVLDHPRAAAAAHDRS